MKMSLCISEQIAFALRQAQGGAPVLEVCRKMGIAEQTFYRWNKRFVGMGVVEVRRLKVLDEWAYRRGVKLNFIRPGKPVEKAFAESFNGRLRDECLNINWFMGIKHAREVIES